MNRFTSSFLKSIVLLAVASAIFWGYGISRDQCKNKTAPSKAALYWVKKAANTEADEKSISYLRKALDATQQNELDLVRAIRELENGHQRIRLFTFLLNLADSADSKDFYRLQINSEKGPPQGNFDIY